MQCSGRGIVFLTSLTGAGRSLLQCANSNLQTKATHPCFAHDNHAHRSQPAMFKCSNLFTRFWQGSADEWAQSYVQIGTSLLSNWTQDLLNSSVTAPRKCISRCKQIASWESGSFFPLGNTPLAKCIISLVKQTPRQMHLTKQTKLDSGPTMPPPNSARVMAAMESTTTSFTPRSEITASRP